MTAVLKFVKITVFWHIAPCSIVEGDRRFRGSYRGHIQGDETLALKTAIFILAAVRT
jgi:hypothetical protein